MPSAFLSKRRVMGIFIPKPFRAQKPSLCGLFLKRRILVLVVTRGRKTFQSHRRGWSSMFRAWKAQRQLLNRRDIAFLSRTSKSLGAKRSLVCSHPKDCWSASLSLLCCGKKNDTGATSAIDSKVIGEG